MGEKILILDDDKDILEILTLILTESGYEVLSLSNGKKIFDEIKNFEPKLILMDVMLGGMDGMEICRSIKAKTQYEDLPVILISATHDLEAFLDLPGAPNDYMEKPFDIDVLISKVEKYLKPA